MPLCTLSDTIDFIWYSFYLLIYLLLFCFCDTPIQIRQSGTDGWSETLKVQQTAISIILNTSPLANSDTEVIIGQLLYWESIWN